ncbi:MAG: serpin family protein [Candidatus Riflebacteria bacterium]|nr:serpin family protein [Candidatus Riflebacteria bacterium]
MKYSLRQILCALLLTLLSLGNLSAQEMEQPIETAPDGALCKPGTNPHSDEVTGPNETSPGVKAIANGGTEFGCDLFRRLATKGGNLFFSPASLHIALAMTFVGAGGETSTQMAKTLHFVVEGGRISKEFGAYLRGLANVGQDDSGKPAAELLIANALWGQQNFPFRPKFIEFMGKGFEAKFDTLDFKDSETARQTINNWVLEKTHDRIRDLIPSGILNALTRLVLTNAIYFKGTWATAFPKAATENETFVASIKENFQVPMMHIRKNFGYGETQDCQILRLPYKGQAVSMVLILPRTIEGLAGLEAGLSEKQLTDWITSLQNCEVIVTMPRLRLEGDFKLREILSPMGMPLAFSDGKADFGGMITPDAIKEGKGLFISEVLHKAFVAIDEEGTEAAAATAVVMRKTTAAACEFAPPKVFKADHPFLFLIRHDPTGALLFLGRCADPRSHP